MDWTRSSFRKAKRHSIGQVIPLPRDVGGCNDQSVTRARTRSNSIPVKTDMKFVTIKNYTVKESRKEKLIDRGKLFKAKKGNKERKMTVNMPVTGWLSNCTHWVEKKKGSYGKTQPEPDDDNDLNTEDKEVQIEEGDVCHCYTTHFLHSEHFNLIGADPLLGNLVISIVYSPVCRLIVRLPHASFYSVHTPAGPLELVRQVLSSLGGRIVSLTPVLCPLAGTLISHYDREFPVEKLITMDKIKEDANRANKVQNLKYELVKRTGDFLKVTLGEDNFEFFCGSFSKSCSPTSPNSLGLTLSRSSPKIMGKFSPFKLASPKSPNCLGLTLPRSSPKTMRKFSPFKLACFSPEVKTKIKKYDLEQNNCLLEDSSESVSTKYLYKPYQSNASPPFDKVEEVFLVEEVAKLNEDINQLKEDNSRLRNEMASLNNKEIKICRELSTTDIILQTLSSMNIV